jgi:hypothetical protein
VFAQKLYCFAVFGPFLVQLQQTNHLPEIKKAPGFPFDENGDPEASNYF